MICYDYVRKNLLIAALLQDIFGRISQVIAVLSLGQQSLVRMKICTIWDSWHPMQTFQTAKKNQMLKSCQDFSVSKQYRSTAPQHAPDSISPGPWSNLGSNPHPSRHWISWSHIFKKQFQPAHGQVIIASRPHLWSRLLKQGTSMASLSKFTPAFFTRCCAWQKKTCPGETEKGENLSPSIWYHFKKKTQRFHINWSTYCIILDCPDSTSPRHKLHTNALATASLFEGTAIGQLQASIWQWFG